MPRQDQRVLINATISGMNAASEENEWKRWEWELPQNNGLEEPVARSESVSVIQETVDVQKRKWEQQQAIQQLPVVVLVVVWGGLRDSHDLSHWTWTGPESEITRAKG